MNEVLSGQKFPGKAFLLTVVEALGVGLEADPRWALAWNRLAVRDEQAGPTAEEVDQLYLEDEELREQLAGAAADEWAGAGRQDGFTSDAIRQWLHDQE